MIAKTQGNKSGSLHKTYFEKVTDNGIVTNKIF